MPKIDMSGAVVQPNSPIYDGVNFAVSRLPAQSYRFQSSAIGDAPNVVLFRHFVGEQGSSINLAPQRERWARWLEVAPYHRMSSSWIQTDSLHYRRESTQLKLLRAI